MEKRKNSLNISAKSFIAAIVIIFLLMAVTYALTFLVPGGEYARTVDEAGHTILDTQAGFREVEGGLPFYKWLLSPLLVLGAEGSGALIAVIAFLLVIGGVFNALNECGLMGYMLQKLVHRFGAVRYRLMAVLILFFMAMGSLVGSFEEVVPLVPIVTSLAVGLGWDVLTGVAMSLLAAGCGFAAGVANPFTIGVAQTLAGLPMFSGVWLRLLSFACIYALLLGFVRFHAKRLPERASEKMAEAHVPDKHMDRGLLLFALILGAGIAVVLSSGFIPALRDFTMIIVAVMFLVAGVAAVLATGKGVKWLLKSFLSGLVAIAPSVLMILMAASIRYILVEGKILDSLLHMAVGAAGNMSRAALVLFIYAICLVLNFFIPSGSAKAFLLIPLIVPLASVFGVNSQLCILAFAFGDGFSNVFYPTNPCLLISLGLVDSSYGKWARYSGKFQLMNLVLTAGLLLFGLAVGY
ncbi:MAG: YfcC family protein [Clostridia bacterium]|nr:YfcC family protein [Clostridia bacterium]MBR0355900.1 YfcC family protein [Clostridia bacterium]